MRTEWIELPVEGSPMEAYLARPTGEGPWPGVLVLMEIFGVNRHIREVTERVAAEGYVALAINYYHRSTRNLELDYTRRGFIEGRRHKEKTTREGILTDVQAGLAFLRARSDVSPKERFATLGFCFGGHAGYIAAVLPDIAATAAFYGGGIATASPGGGAPTVTHTPDIRGEMLCLFGERDPLIPIADMETIGRALAEAGIPHQVKRYAEAGHGFFCDQREDYHPQATTDAWNEVTTLFHRTLKR